MRTVRLVVAALLLVACACPDGRAETGLGEPVRLQVPVTFPMTVAAGSYWFRFSLYRRTDPDHPEAFAWSEAMSLAGPKKTLATTKLTHVLGSLDPVGHPLPAWVFQDQLWARAECRKAGQWVACSKLVKLAVVPYAMWSAATDQPSCVPGDWVSCYTGPGGTIGKGPCKAGTRTCSEAGTFVGMGCTGQVLPQDELCNGVDDDCDGAIDDDPVDGPCEPLAEVVCDDGVDDDGDELTDCLDPDCAAAPECATPPVEICDDGHDNDGDMKSDCADPDCGDWPACAFQ